MKEISSFSEKKSSFSEGLIPKLSNAEIGVLNIIREGIIDTARIASRRQTGIRNIQKIIRKLKKKGVLGISSPIANQSELSGEQKTLSGELNGIRLHAEQFSITPLTKSQKYTDAIGKKITIDNNTILIHNGLAVKMEGEGEKIRIRSNELGKVWFEIDNSWNLHEAETKGKTAQRDMQGVIEPYFNDMRDKDNFLPSDVKKMIEGLVMTSSNMVNYSMK